ncbi:hypothetical protein LJ655_08970 [Paraburkholderia sp. MMS20-SJTN17]|uniref:AcrB/AcrD/AcrF family protein n=1 Tax=Paraburkholderia translucens TaxID=2886945 RepID=A0ABS8KC29_9BURK|nr:hypothetical protein [Paraburkholderia sp. MMS20-SJTN17]MCC8402023.1 hypothetical protein [Paraburkholderia sp. MMS20-SJTN17]
MASVTVTTSEELKAAQEAKVDEILVTGELAGKLKSARTVATLGPAAIAALSVIALTAIPSGGLSTMGLVPVAALTGMEISAIIFVAFMGITSIIALFKDYDVEFTTKGAKYKKRR